MSVVLTPLSAAHLDGVAKLWGDPAVIRDTNISAPCGRQQAAERLTRLLACQAGLPARLCASGPFMTAAIFGTLCAASAAKRRNHEESKTTVVRI